ncbi:nuclear transport factor 2 family protein [Chitinimonas sp. JJ19]|uniref:nuclear transport factor 2 family protein n=1 Tax=Chitinimonas sp. JJ19 TaxID=3109352 RepID=UPI001A5068A3|nr:nuclear transport factor 2 family protein [Chitinimonas sp.]
MKPRFEEIIRWFESLTPASLTAIASCYAPQARFKDPFNDVRGLPAIERIYQHMFETLEQPRFVVESCIAEAERAFVVWRFEFGLRGRAMVIRGGSQLELDSQGLIVLHHDYWDAAEQLYEHVPVLGAVLRMIKRRLAI